MKFVVLCAWQWFSARIAPVVALMVSALPGVAHACPMCFNGDNSNAFVVGSLFLMVVPTTALGGLGYWAYRRIRAHELDLDVDFETEAVAQAQGYLGGQAHVVAEPSRKTEASQSARLRVVE